MSQTIAIHHVTVVTMDEDRSILRDALVVVEGNRIKEVRANVSKLPKADHVIDGTGKVLMPGLINCHTHSRPARALGDGLGLEIWHDLYADNVTRHMTKEDSRIGSLINFAESIKCGTTSTVDMTYMALGAGEAAKQIGIRATIVPLAADHPEMADSTDSFEDNITLVRDHRDICPERVRFWMGCDSITETSPEMLSAMVEAAEKYDTGIHTHMSEARYDTSYFPNKYGKRPAAFLQDLGVLGPRTILAHCNHLTWDEIDILRETGTSVAHNAGTNMKGGNGVCPVPDLLRAGVTVGLGTDGMLSNYKLDLFEIIRSALKLQRITHLDARVIRTDQVFELATLGGARALGLEDEIGSIEVGKKADFILLNFQDIKFSPWIQGGKHDNLNSMLAWTASGDDVETVVIDGQIVMEERQLKFVDEQELIAIGSETAARILSNF